MSSRNDCQRRLLAERSSCRVEACSCGTLHVSLGAITMRIAPELAASLVTTLSDALITLTCHNPPEPVASSPSAPDPEAAPSAPTPFASFWIRGGAS